ncbi:MAG TPA: hypothetical protein VIY67_06895 [Nitrospiraceae bacterium]
MAYLSSRMLKHRPAAFPTLERQTSPTNWRLIHYTIESMVQ